MTWTPRIRIGVLVPFAAMAACQTAIPPAPSPAQDRAQTLTPYPVRDWSASGGLSNFADTKRICASVLHAEPPAAELPTPEEQAALKGCNSEALYFGIGMHADPARARKCAMIERTVKRDAPYRFFEAEGMLAMVYANGRGAARNYDVAIHMACGIEDAPAATNSRIFVLAEYRRSAWKGDSFNTCDDNTSGVGQGICADHDAKIAEQERGKRIARLKRGWTAEQRRLFDGLYASLRGYADAAHDMDCRGGTAQAACAIQGQNIDTGRFLERIEALVQGSALPKDAPSEGLQPAIATREWDFRYEFADESEREWLTDNRKDAITARRVFERDLIAFISAALPRFTPHEIRGMFANI